MSEIVLKSVVEKLEALENTIKELKENLNVVTDYPRELEKKLSEVNVNPPAVDLTAVHERINQGVLKIKMVIEAQPKIIKRDFNFHLFPKINIKEYYQTYSKLVLFVMALILIVGLAWIGWGWIDGYNKRQNDLEQVEAVKQYEENELQLDIKRNNAKLAASRNAEAIRVKTANDKLILERKQLMDSIKTGFAKRVNHFLYDSLHK